MLHPRNLSRPDSYRDYREGLGAVSRDESNIVLIPSDKLQGGGVT